MDNLFSNKFKIHIQFRIKNTLASGKTKNQLFLRSKTNNQLGKTKGIILDVVPLPT